jgi:hypothetical protein
MRAHQRITTGQNRSSDLSFRPMLEHQRERAEEPAFELRSLSKPDRKGYGPERARLAKLISTEPRGLRSSPYIWSMSSELDLAHLGALVFSIVMLAVETGAGDNAFRQGLDPPLIVSARVWSL